MMQRKYQNAFDEVFLTQYAAVHRLETNKLRNVAKFFAHLLGINFSYASSKNGLNFLLKFL